MRLKIKNKVLSTALNQRCNKEVGNYFTLAELI